MGKIKENFRENLVNFFGWIFLLGPIVFLIFYPVYVFVFCKPFTLPVVVMAGIFVAIGTQLLVQGKHLSDKREEFSLFHLETCVSVYKRACDILQDGNNDRVKWIRAARILAHAKELEAKITEKSHRTAFKAYMLEYQHILHTALHQPAGFYYGAPSDKIRDLKASKKWAEDEKSRKKEFVDIEEAALTVMVEIAEWLNEYGVMEDPLKDRELSQIFFEDTWTVTPFAVRYPTLFAFLAKKHGKLYPEGTENPEE
ncbi:MAG: hypothetical protein MPJ22_02830 [Pirellulales bacterium]|nr:hypothetical protein [Pirellulales bacterium]